jgi:hypothetical protein
MRVSEGLKGRGERKRREKNDGYEGAMGRHFIREE